MKSPKSQEIAEAKPRKKKLTVRQRLLVQAKASGKTHLEASEIAGYSQRGTPESRRVEVTKTLQKPSVREELERALKKHEITIDKALAPIAEALEHENIEIKLKGSDRALKLHGVGQTSVSVSITEHVEEQRKLYDL